jgi:hypothetical protein
MNSKIETSLLLFVIVIVFLIGCYLELNKQAIADDAYVRCYKEEHPEIPNEEIIIPTHHNFSFYVSSMHTMALISFGASIFFFSLFLYYIFVERKKGM